MGLSPWDSRCNQTATAHVLPRFSGALQCRVTMFAIRSVGANHGNFKR